MARSRRLTASPLSQQASSCNTSSGEKGWTIFRGSRTFLMLAKGDREMWLMVWSQLKKQDTSRW